MFNFWYVFIENLIFYHKSAKTGHIPKPVALDDLVGSSSAFCACVPYIHMVYLHKCLEISPTGTNPPYNAIFLLKHYKPKTNIHKF